MQAPTIDVPSTENRDFVHGTLEQRLQRGELDVPLLPEVAMRVVRASEDLDTGAAQLAAIVNADPALTMYVLRVAASAAKRPANPVVSVHQAVAWLGLDEVANIAFSMAVQAKILNVPGQQQRVRRLWRHSLACALWSKHLAHTLGRDGSPSYLCGLLHEIGKPVALAAVTEIAQRNRMKLSGADYDLLTETFHRAIGAQVVTDWGMPPCVLDAVTNWEWYAAAAVARSECIVVHVAHRLADLTLTQSTKLARESVQNDPAYRDLGFTPRDAAALFDAAGPINAELDCYLAP